MCLTGNTFLINPLFILCFSAGDPALPCLRLLPFFRNRRNGIDKVLQLSLKHFTDLRIRKFLLASVLFCDHLTAQLRIPQHPVCGKGCLHGIVGGQQNAAAAQGAEMADESYARMGRLKYIASTSGTQNPS